MSHREAYKAMWVQGLYEEQPDYPGDPMTLEEAKSLLESVAARPEEFITPPEGITPEELQATWNKAHRRALEATKEAKERRGEV